MTNHVINLILNLAQIKDYASKWRKYPLDQLRVESDQISSKQLQNCDVRNVDIKTGSMTSIVQKDPIWALWVPHVQPTLQKATSSAQPQISNLITPMDSK